MTTGGRGRKWLTTLVLMAAIVVAAGYASTVVLDALNLHISRCSDQSAPEYIADRAERAHSCGRE
ncbi:hypothetical protein [Methylobacterium indicum]|uniref:Uncharacterized protein n=1 Tax=Methylobacterium indicum TaxID=1775910 RepID=A0ABR5HGW3_9HYPH|nr:hypothetical protein [Methylobacterium indicum]KMO11473.1 hypothetical protein QR78_28310 [Methylobacterium indicum]KMO25880.1 hypothetical protein QR79_05515 [Methylobacterium indicum]